MAYWYRVTTQCTATIREQWTVRSRVPLTRPELDAIAVQGIASPDIAVMCLEDETVIDESDRTIVDVDPIVVAIEDEPYRH